MGLEKYTDLRKKIESQMMKQVKDVKTIMVEQWAKKNGFGEVYFNNYEEAKTWVEENVNKDKDKRKNFCNFENEADEITTALAEELENGSSSKFVRTVRNINQKFISPTVKMLLSCVAINFIATQAVGFGMNLAGARLHEMAAAAIEGINVSENFRINVKDARNVSVYI